MTTTLTREKITDGTDQRYAVKDEHGAAEFSYLIASEIPMGIKLHLARPVRVAGWCNEDCDLLPAGQCWADVSFAGGRDVFNAWLHEGRDDEVIWGALEAWHAERVAPVTPETVTTAED